VYIRLCGQREVKVDDVGDVLEVDSSGDAELFVLRPEKQNRHFTVSSSVVPHTTTHLNTYCPFKHSEVQQDNSLSSSSLRALLLLPFAGLQRSSRVGQTLLVGGDDVIIESLIELSDDVTPERGRLINT